MEKFDLIVVGSGSGLEISAEASDRGMPVASTISPGTGVGPGVLRFCLGIFTDAASMVTS